MYRLISTKTVVAKLYRDLRLTDSRHVSDMLEWFGEAMGYIKVFPALHRKVVELEVEMHRVELPVDLMKIQQVLKMPNQLVMRYNSSTFPRSLHTRDSPNRYASSDVGYIVNFNYLETDFETGEVALSYLATPMDEDGYPMIPDDSAFQEALKWYVALRMNEGGWKHPAGLQYPDIERRWFHYCGQARQRNKMPDIDQYQNFLESWVRLVPDYTRHESVFESVFRGYASDLSHKMGQVEGLQVKIVND